MPSSPPPAARRLGPSYMAGGKTDYASDRLLAAADARDR